jgi:predicted TIM-barrel fold metal-dependent hydrolase
MKRESLNRRGFLAGTSLAGVASFLTANTMGDSAQGAQLEQTTPVTPRDHTVKKRQKPLAPDVIERDTIDGGFSKGLFPHISPAEELWVDSHIHIDNLADGNAPKITDKDSLIQVLDEWFARVGWTRLGKIVGITAQERFELFGEVSKTDPRFAWMWWPNIDAPDPSKIRNAVANGSCAIKIHNGPIMAAKTPRNVFQRNDWQEIFAYAESNDIPLLWHVVQRVNPSAYHGRGISTMWSPNQDFTNKDLLNDVLAVMRRYPKLKIVGAHALHLGIDRLDELFQEFENLYIEGSTTLHLRWADDFSDEVRALLQDFFQKWSKRVLFGTDITNVSPGRILESTVRGYLNHPRFFLKLWLSDDALQNIAWRNAYRLFKLTPGLWARRGNVRT